MLFQCHLAQDANRDLIHAEDQQIGGQHNRHVVIDKRAQRPADQE